jgi:DNA-binding NtrC family response regulator
MVLRSRLADQGYDVEAVETGAKGLAEAREGTFDLYLVSSGLTSGVDGLEVCRRLKVSPDTNTTPLVLFTNKPSSPEEVDRCYEAGCEAFVTKAEQSATDHVVRMLLRIKTSADRLQDEVRTLEHTNKRLQDDRKRGGETETVRESGDHQLALRELAAGRIDGLLVVDTEGCVAWADRGACELLGNRIEGQHLGSLAPASGLEAFVRDARTDARTGFRFDLSAHSSQTSRSLLASVVPLMSRPGHGPGGRSGAEDGPLKVVLLRDAAKRRLVAELLSIDEPCLPRRESGPLLEAAHEVYSPAGLIGNSPVMETVRSMVAQAGSTLDPVLIHGEPGTGRERLARTLHYAGSSTGPFLQVHCGAIAPENMEVELFGHGGPGVLQRAQDGTLLLEELAELEPELQTKLLEALRTGSVQRSDAAKPARINVRVVATTSRSPEAITQEDRILPELFELISCHTIALPPLRDRGGDIDPLTHHFVASFGSMHEITDVSEEVLWMLSRYEWPGNVRELRDCIDYACARAREGIVEAEHLPSWLTDKVGRPEHDLIPRPERSSAPGASQAAPGRRELRPWDITDDDPVSLDLYEKKALLRAIDTVGGDKLAAAKLLNVGKSTLYRKLKRFGIQ